MSAEVRDKLAGLEGWKCGIRWEHTDGRQWHIDAHPIPDDLNTCAAMWDKYAGEHVGLLLMLAGSLEAYVADCVQGPGTCTVQRSGTDAASELRDRWALLGEVLKARGVV